MVARVPLEELLVGENQIQAEAVHDKDLPQARARDQDIVTGEHPDAGRPSSSYHESEGFAVGNLGRAFWETEHPLHDEAHSGQ
jgi:hypothetical protein